MDNRQEQRCIKVLRDELTAGQTFIVSTHKTALLELVDRLIIMDNQGIVIDGPKEKVLNELRRKDKASNATGSNATKVQATGRVESKKNQQPAVGIKKMSTPNLKTPRT